MLEQITPLILTFNEAPNIERTLNQLTWAERSIVSDSFSTDETLEILSRFSNVEVFQRPFDTHANQWNYGLEKSNADWVLSLDADYIVSDALKKELDSLSLDEIISGYFIPFQYYVLGKPLRSSILPPRQALFRRELSSYVDDGHTQLLVGEGLSDRLTQPIIHDDRKPINRWFSSEMKYAKLEAKKLRELPVANLTLKDKIRKQKFLSPFLILFYCLILRGGLFDGWRGLYYVSQRVLAEILLGLTFAYEEFSFESSLSSESSLS